MDLWRKALDMKIPVHDEFKIHFIEKRGTLLNNFERTSRVWKNMLGSMSALPGSEAELASLIAAVDDFHEWALSELKKLASIELQENINSVLDDSTNDPLFQELLRNIVKPPPKKGTSGS